MLFLQPTHTYVVFVNMSAAQAGQQRQVLGLRYQTEVLPPNCWVVAAVHRFTRGSYCGSCFEDRTVLCAHLPNDVDKITDKPLCIPHETHYTVGDVVRRFPAAWKMALEVAGAMVMGEVPPQSYESYAHVLDLPQRKG